MESNQIANRTINLDLSFHGVGEDILRDFVDENSKDLLTNQISWENELRAWITEIKEDLNIKCPNLIRKYSSLSLGLKLTDDLTIKNLNLAWRNKAEPTDVLSFPILDETFVTPQDEFIELGDIVISVTTAQRQAKKYNHELSYELKWLVSHGLLHLLGWDHPNDEALTKMLHLQKHLLNINVNVQSRLLNRIGTLNDQ